MPFDVVHSLMTFNSALFLSDNLDRIPKHLIDLAKKGFSSDNITIIIVFFKHPSKIQRPTEIMESPTFDSFDVAAVKIEASEVSFPIIIL